MISLSIILLIAFSQWNIVTADVSQPKTSLLVSPQNCVKKQ